MSPDDEADFCFFETIEGQPVCTECDEPCEEVGRLRLCLRCDLFENGETVGTISAVLRRLPADHALLKEFEAEGLAGLDVEELAIAIWEHIAEQELQSQRRMA